MRRARREVERRERRAQLAEMGKLAAGPGADASRNRIITLRKEADRLAATLDDFLRFAGRMEIRPAPAPLNELVQDLVDFFLPQARASNVRLHTALASEQPVVSLDANLFKQALLNLMINAQQAMANGGDLIIRTHVAADHVIVDVSDTGVGISPDHLQHIFDAYYTTKKGGTGLGLPTTRRIIEEHHGHIGVTSDPGRGTNFRIELPLPQHETRQDGDDAADTDPTDQDSVDASADEAAE
jgi:two-component system sensor histidine kinase HydH